MRLAFDDSYFSGPAVNPAWPSTYIPEGVVPADQLAVGRRGPDPTGFGFVADPRGRGRRRPSGPRCGATGSRCVRRSARAVGARRTADDVALGARARRSGEIVERTLEVSDNQAAEVLARHVGLAERQEGSFRGGAASVLDVLRSGSACRVAGDQLYDGSGLSRRNRLSPDTLAGVLRLAASADHPELRAGADRAAGRRLHRLAGSTASTRARPRPAAGCAPRPGRSPGCTGWPASPTTSTAAGWRFVVDRRPGRSRARSSHAQTLDRPHRRRAAARAPCGVGSSP